MNKIGIIKIGTKLENIQVKKDKNGMYKELVDLCVIMRTFGNKEGYSIYFLDNELLKQHHLNSFDVIYVLNGIIISNTIAELEQIKQYTKRLFYILTDLRLINHNIIQYFNAIYTQAKYLEEYYYITQYYNGMPELALYNINKEQIKQYYNNFNFKQKLFVFGGGFKDRSEKIFEYILNNKLKDNRFEFYGKGYMFNKEFDTRVPINEYHKILIDTKYSIVIADKENNANGFITWRYFENIARGIITFFDYEYDKDNLIDLDKTTKEFLRVKNGQELIDKINILENNEQVRQKVLDEQLKLISEYKISGEYTYNQLMNWR
jgi:hypothetical protein